MALEFFLHLPSPTWLAVKMIVIFALFETLLLLVVPGKRGFGPVRYISGRYFLLLLQPHGR